MVYYCCCGASVVIAEAFWLASRPVDHAMAPAPSGRRLDRAESIAPAALHPSKRHRRSRAR
jgi:hypothetical protein